MASQALTKPAATAQALAKPATPSTPTAQTARPSTPRITDSPGTWRHPRLEEITRRRNATVFTSTDLQRVALNSALLLTTLLTPPSFLQPLARLYTAVLASIPPGDIPWEQYGTLALRLVLLTNILMALRPLYAARDECADVALTPSQRKLLGLDPSHGGDAAPRPLTPGSGYITPPRYARSASGTPRTGSSRRAVAGSSPLSGRSPSNTPLGSPFYGGSPGQPPSGSPLLRNTLTGSGNGGGGGAGNSGSRRWSFGSPHSPLGLGRSGSDSLLGMGFADSTSSVPQSPSPSGAAGRGKGGAAGVQLNSKWLYEKGRVSLGGSRAIY